MDLVSFHDFILELMSEQFGAPVLPRHACWFHHSRVPAGTKFENGLLPLSLVQSDIEAAVLACVDDPAVVAAICEAFAGLRALTRHFQDGLRNPVHHGPYATQVHETADDRGGRTVLKVASRCVRVRLLGEPVGPGAVNGLDGERLPIPPAQVIRVTYLG